ncbi:MAG: glycosyltransferase family 1 protein [Candidatus Gracilibacteria bacterium]|jgi:glycosyltransferase involved in cell wall biosynthesis
MNIVIDIRPLMGGKISGIEIYIKNLIENLVSIDQTNTYILFANASSNQMPFLPKIKSKNLTIIQTRIPNKILNFLLIAVQWPKLDQLILRHLDRNPHLRPESLKKDQIDLFFMPDLRPSALSKEVRKILTIHDLSFLHFPKFFSLKTRLWYKLINPQKEIKSADKIIAVSEFTKKDILQNIDYKGQIKVIHQGIAENFCQNIKTETTKQVLRKYHLQEPYLLFLSTIEPRKNVNRLAEAFNLYKKRHSQSKIKLVIAGKEDKKIFSKVKLEENKDIIFAGFIEENQKESLVKGATAFIYPSLFEGFGLPLLEAMKCGVPVITSNTSSMPEVIGDAGILINPKDIESISKAIEEIQKPEIQEKLKNKMKEQIKKFSWGNCAKETLDYFDFSK